MLANPEVVSRLIDSLTKSDAMALMIDPFARLISDEPWPHYVYYFGGEVTYVPPDRFFLLAYPKGVSDSVWIVPGTL